MSNYIPAIGVDLSDTVHKLTNLVQHIGQVAADTDIDTTAPPLGIKPRFIMDEYRLQEIAEGMVRFIAAGYDIPNEWIHEYMEIINRMDKREKDKR